MDITTDYYLHTVSAGPNEALFKKCVFKRDLEKEKLSFVLPFATKRSTPQHHSGENENCEHSESSRLKISLLSIVQNFHLPDLCEFLIISPSRDIRHAEKILRSVTLDKRFKVISEVEICPEFGALGLLASSRLSTLPRNLILSIRYNHILRQDFSGWRKQQLVKLAAHDIVKSSHYMTLDADVVCIRKFALSDMIRDGKALCQAGGMKNYLNLYTDCAAGEEHSLKMKRCLNAARILGFNRPVECRGRVYSETPVIMNTEGVGMLAQYLQNKYRLEWRKYLIKNFFSWTEYPLYFQFLEGTGLLEQMYTAPGPYELWDLSRSVWHPEHWYRHKRESDDIDEYLKGAKGFFIVLQTGWKASSGDLFKKIADKILSLQ